MRRTTYLFSAATMTWLIGMAIGSASSWVSVFPSTTALTLLTLSVFGFGMLFFSYIAPLAMFLIGSHIGMLARQTPEFSIPIAVLTATSFMAAYSSIRLSHALFDDLRGRENFKSMALIAVIVLAAALVISLAVDVIKL